MKACATLLLAAISCVVLPMGTAWVTTTPTTTHGRPSIHLWDSNAPLSTETADKVASPTLTTVQVCHGKDCKRIGGGAKLLKAVEQVRHDSLSDLGKLLVDTFVYE